MHKYNIIIINKYTYLVVSLIPSNLIVNVILYILFISFLLHSRHSFLHLFQKILIASCKKTYILQSIGLFLLCQRILIFNILSLVRDHLLILLIKKLSYVSNLMVGMVLHLLKLLIFLAYFFAKILSLLNCLIVSQLLLLKLLLVLMPIW